MTRSVSDAEDIVQEAFARLAQALRRGTPVSEPEAYLATTALDIADGALQAIRCVVNPDKLRHIGQVSELASKPPPETPLAG